MHKNVSKQLLLLYHFQYHSLCQLPLFESCFSVWFMGAPDPPIQTQNSSTVSLMPHHTPYKDMQQIIIQELLDRVGHGVQEGA